jgi:hypothetical protein
LEGGFVIEFFLVDFFEFKQVQSLLFCELAFLLMQEVSVLLGLEPNDIKFLLSVVGPSKIAIAPIPLHLFNANGLFPHFVQKLLNIEILFLDFLMQVRVFLFENSLLALQVFQAFYVLVDLTSLELDVFLALDQLLLQ